MRSSSGAGSPAKRDGECDANRDAARDLNRATRDAMHDAMRDAKRDIEQETARGDGQRTSKCDVSVPGSQLIRGSE